MNKRNQPIRVCAPSEFPAQLLEIPDPPKKLYILGDWPVVFPDTKYLAVVGSRKYTEYGKEACVELIRSLAGTHTIIVSGLAIGIDAIAHKTALDVGLPTIAVPGSGLSREVLYPRQNVNLADAIVSTTGSASSSTNAGGCVISEFEPDFHAMKGNFPQRNRIMAGLAHAVLVIEASERSGTLITARLALDYNRDVAVVPGQIFSANAAGTNKLLHQGAYPITCADDLRTLLGIEPSEITASTGNISSGTLFDPLKFSEHELQVLDILSREQVSKESLIQKTNLSAVDLNIVLSQLEIKRCIKETSGIFSLINEHSTMP